jgi:uncharacterized protein YjbI with pentapeptide repeats
MKFAKRKYKVPGYGTIYAYDMRHYLSILGEGGIQDTAFLSNQILSGVDLNTLSDIYTDFRGSDLYRATSGFRRVTTFKNEMITNAHLCGVEYEKRDKI